ncbi:MAG: N-acetylmuramoyl-L-alanine amidase [Candidatus Gastranaerophilales bacterium]
MKKILIYIMIFIVSFITCELQVSASEVQKITSANFDTSNAMMILTSQDESETEILQSLKLTQLEEPKRAYFDIDNAVLTFGKKEWNFTSGIIKQIKISQFETEPSNKVRVVLYYENDLDLHKIKFFRVKNNIILKFNDNNFCDNEYFQTTYRDEHASSSDFYEYITVTSPAEPTISEPQLDEVVDEINQAFQTSIKEEPPETPMTKKEILKLNTKYHLDKVSAKSDAILLNGFGTVSIERPYILSNPSRIVYDLPNTLTSPEVRNTELQLNETDTVKIGQFSVNKARVVIYTEDVNKYLPIYSSDNQSLIIANTEKIDTKKLSGTPANVISYHHDKTDRNSSMVLAFDQPIVHGVDRFNSKFDIYIYNAEKYNQENFKSTFANTIFENANIELLPDIGLKLSIPMHQNDMISSFIGADGRSLKITVREAKIKLPEIFHPTQTNFVKKRIMLDAGHGGKDSGALSGDILEKDITLDVAKLVKNILEKQGHEVIMTRNNDSYVSLEERVEVSENATPDLFVSIHVNSSVKPQIDGVETHYYHQHSMALAQTVHTELASSIKSTNRGLFKSKFYVINHTTMPAILVEIGFISNAAERKELISNKRKKQTAKAIAEGIGKYIEQK